MLKIMGESNEMQPAKGRFQNSIYLYRAQDAWAPMWEKGWTKCVLIPNIDSNGREKTLQK